MEFEDPGYTDAEIEEFVRLCKINERLIRLIPINELVQLVFGKKLENHSSS